MKKPHPHCTPGRSRQRGVAAIEFVAGAFVFLLLLYGFSIFGQSFNTKQVLSRAATDGARAISLIDKSQSTTQIGEAIHAFVAHSMLDSGVAPSNLSLSVGQTMRERQLIWLKDPSNVLVRVTRPDADCGSPCYRVEVGFNYNQNYVPKFAEPPAPPPGGTAPPPNPLKDIGGIKDEFIVESAYVKI